MRPEFDMTIHISTERGEVVVEQQKAEIGRAHV